MNKKHILVAISGGIAAFKICSLVSSLHKAGYDVRVMLTENGARMVAPAALAALSHHPVVTETFPEVIQEPIPHIALAEWADLVMVAPATANIIAKIANGLADDLVTSTLLALTCPKLIAPAMNTHMLENPATQRNIAVLQKDGWQIIQPDSGILACEEVGSGRLPEPSVLMEAIENRLSLSGFSAEDPRDAENTEKAEKAAKTESSENTVSETQANQETAADSGSKNDQQLYSQDSSIDSEDDIQPDQESESVLLDDAMDRFKPLKGMHVLISAGPTQEALDPVRFISNHSSGKQGIAIAEDAKLWGADVILVHGPILIPVPEGIDSVSVRSATEMEQALLKRADWADFIIMAAAVGDYRPKTVASQKIKKSDESMMVEFVKNPDILAELGKRKPSRQVLCGFAMETENLEVNARQKMEKKNCDLLIANNLTTPGAGFQNDTNQVSMLMPDSVERLPLQSKKQLGFTILARMLEIWKGKA